jgi:hypothetical protein
MKMRFSTIMNRLLAAAVALCISTAAFGQKIQCWTDENGQRSCGDSVPPKYADRERQEINERGIATKQVPRAKTPAEQIAEEQAREKARKEADDAAKAAQRQQAYDRYLVESYRSVKDLEKARQERLAALDTRIVLVEKAIASGQAQLDALVARRQSLQKSNFPVDKKLEEQIKEYRRAIIENPKALEQLKMEREKVDTQFTADIARYYELTGTQASEVEIP